MIWHTVLVVDLAVHVGVWVWLIQRQRAWVRVRDERLAAEGRWREAAKALEESQRKLMEELARKWPSQGSA